MTFVFILEFEFRNLKFVKKVASGVVFSWYTIMLFGKDAVDAIVITYGYVRATVVG